MVRNNDPTVTERKRTRRTTSSNKPDESQLDYVKNKLFFLIPIAVIIVIFIVWYIYYNKKKKLLSKQTSITANSTVTEPEKTKYVDGDTGKEIPVKLVNAGLYIEKETTGS